MQQYRKLIWLSVSFILLLIFIWDFSERIDGNSTLRTTMADFEVVEYSENKTFDDTQREKILGLYTTYDISKRKTPVEQASINKKVGLTPEEQKNQHGKLNEFYIGDYTYSLLGIFQESHSFAVLAQKNIITNENKEIVVVLHQYLAPYKVTKITDAIIEFTLDQQRIELSLF